MAIKIIKPGKKPDTTRRFTCDHCGCVFDADLDDYETVTGQDNWLDYRAICPACRERVWNSVPLNTAE